MPAIYYFCTDKPLTSAGIRIIYRHVEILARHGFSAAVMHVQEGFKMPDMPAAPVAYLSQGRLAEGDIVVAPEGEPNVLNALKGLPIRIFVNALNWDYIYKELPRDMDWRSFGVERVMSHSAFIADFVSWSMGLPVRTYRWGIDSALYFPSQEKQREIVYIDRKQDRIKALMMVLSSRDARFVNDIKWTALKDLSEADYAAAVRRAVIFLNLSRAEGLPCSLLEAMRCRTLVAGYSSVGGQRELIGEGPRQNMILAEMLDYPALAVKLEPVLLDILKGDVSGHDPIIQNAFATAVEYDRAAEEASVVDMWREILARDSSVGGSTGC